MPKLVTASANHTLDALLELVCQRIQLTETQDTAAREHYDAVSDWLARDGSPLQLLDPYIYPQGSQRLQTTTKPVRQTEFDLDAICRLDVRTKCHPGAVYRLLWDRLWENKVYRKIMVQMPRCVRLEYSGDFHLDIAPAIPDLWHGGDCILVPDLDANLAFDHPENDRWKLTCPQGYAKWFQNRCVQRLARARNMPGHKLTRSPIRSQFMQSRLSNAAFNCSNAGGTSSIKTGRNSRPRRLS